MKQKKAYKYRFSPSPEQKRLLAQTFGCCRYVYNWALRQRTDAYYQHGERLYYEATAQRLVTLKKQEETLWLNEVSSVPLQQALRHLDKAFRNFFEGRADYPTFKKKRHQQAATYASNAFSWDGHTLTLARWRLRWLLYGIAPCLKDASQVVSPLPKMRRTATLSLSW